jgi:hypothetical protein
VSKLRGVVGFKVREFFQESRNLGDNPEKIIRVRMIVHFKALNGFIILNDRVKGFFLQLLPISTQVVLGVGVEK